MITLRKEGLQPFIVSRYGAGMEVMEGRAARAERLVADAIGELIEFWGFRGVMGRCWALLYLSEDPLPAKAICERLEISTGAASMALGDLERWGVVRRLRLPGERRDYFEAETDVWKMISRVYRERELVQIERALDALSRAQELFELEAKLGGIGARRRARFALARAGALVELTKLGRSLLRLFVEEGKVDFSPLRRFARR